MTKDKSFKLSDKFYIGIDYGDKNIGVALGRNGLVTPLATVDATNLNSAFHEILRYTIENKVDTYIVGLPLNGKGQETKSSLKVRTFVNKLKVYTKRQVIYQNEYATSKDADEEMIDFEIAQKKRRSNDRFAAALILKQFFTDNS